MPNENSLSDFHDPKHTCLLKKDKNNSIKIKKYKELKITNILPEITHLKLANHPSIQISIYTHTCAVNLIFQFDNISLVSSLK